MSISAVTNVFSAYAQQITGGASPNASASVSAEQEANETVAQTKQEAAHGDKVAKAKLAKVQQKQQLQSGPTPGAAEPGKGAAVDKVA